MIIDQLTPVSTDSLTDELPVEVGTTTFKTTLQKIFNLFKSVITATDITSTNGNVQTDITYLRGENTARINTDVNHNDDFAPAYSSSSTYKLGQLVIYNNKLYKCTTAITTAEAWTSGHWSAVKVSNYVENEVLYFKAIPCSALTGNFVEYFSDRITSDHVLVSVDFSIPSAISPYITWNTSGSNQRLRINGTCTDATCTCNVVLVKKHN